MQIKKRPIEIQRTNLTESQFKAYCRQALRKSNWADGWLDHICKELGHIDGTRQTREASDDHWYDEVCDERIGNVQYYCNPNKEGKKHGLGGYNFIYEFTYDDDKKGSGYFFLNEWD